MKGIVWSVVFCLLLMTTGCGTVVYRVNPDSPPQMSISEARDALELSISMMSPHARISGFVVKDDELYLPWAIVSGGGLSRVSYGEITPEVVKRGEQFYVSLLMSSLQRSENMTISWNSEEDARQFVNGAYVLRRKKGVDKRPVEAIVSRAKTIQSARPADDKIVKVPSKADIADQTARKDVAVREDEKPRIQTSTKTPADKSPPSISITSHDINSSAPVIAHKSSITIAGKVTDDSGVADVFVNDQQVDLDEKGQFSVDLLLRVGQNPIVVKAMNIKRSEATKQFVVTREYRRKDTAVSVEKKSMPQPSIRIADAKSAPRIVITAPDVTRAVSVVAKKTTVTVTGVAESEAGIMDVQINGQQAEVDDKGNFSIEVPLRIGQNQIVVTAVDVRNNRSAKHFVINRESGKIAAAKAEPVVPVAGLQSAKYYALFIAVQDYISPEINRLDYPMSDAKQIMETLISQYTFEREDVLFLQNPDRRAIYKSFQDMRKRLTEKDNLLVFYAGHGTWMDDMQQGFWLPKDAAGPNDPSDWISNSNIRDYIKAIKAKHILLVSDSCFSGGIFKVRDAFAKSRTSIEKIYEMPSRKAITSGSLKTVPDHSVFVEFLVKRLKDNRDPYLDTQKLFAGIREAVINNSATSQTPLYGAINEAGDEGGDFVFVRRP